MRARRCEKIEDAGGEGFAVAADMRDPAAVTAMVQGGGASAAVGSTTSSPMRRSIRSCRGTPTTIEDFNELFETNVRGAWVVCTEGAKQMIAEGHGGAIVMISSISAHVGAPTQVAYCGTKGAISMLGKALGSVLGDNGIRVNVVEPGAVTTNMSAPMLDMPDVMKYYIDRIALHRIAEPSELAATVAFLLSDDASYVTSATLLVDAGLHRQRRALTGAEPTPAAWSSPPRRARARASARTAACRRGRRRRAARG